MSSLKKQRDEGEEGLNIYGVKKEYVPGDVLLLEQKFSDLDHVLAVLRQQLSCPLVRITGEIPNTQSVNRIRQINPPHAMEGEKERRT